MEKSPTFAYTHSTKDFVVASPPKTIKFAVIHFHTASITIRSKIKLKA